MTNQMPKDRGRRAATGRRNVLGGAIALGVAAPFVGPVRAATDPSKERPQPGDILVYAQGSRKGEAITPEDLPLGGPQEMAYPMDPATEVIRDGSRLNQVVLIRLDPEQLTDETRSHAAEGVVAYSAVCTHQGCPVSMWKTENQTLYCSCHGTEYAPADNARVVNGPAPRRLAILPLKFEQGVLMAAAEFSGRVGFKK